jgi:hypothetical protein
MTYLTRRITVAVAALALAVVAPGGPAQASVTIDIYQSGSDVITTETGTIDLTGLSFLASGSQTPGLVPSIAEVLLGSSRNFDYYTGAVGPSSFGPGSKFVPASSASGDVSGVIGAHRIIVVPAGYVSGTFLSATDTCAGQSFSSVGLTPGTYTYTWSSDSLTVLISVPEPPSILPVVFAAVLGLGYAWRRRRAQAPG